MAVERDPVAGSGWDSSIELNHSMQRSFDKKWEIRRKCGVDVGALFSSLPFIKDAQEVLGAVHDAWVISHENKAHQDLSPFWRDMNFLSWRKCVMVVVAVWCGCWRCGYTQNRQFEWGLM